MTQSVGIDFTSIHARYWAWVASNEHLAKLKPVQDQDPVALDKMASSNLPSDGVQALLRFVLSVWNPYHKWKCGKFTLSDIQSLDRTNRAWVAAWFQEPFWP